MPTAPKNPRTKSKAKTTVKAKTKAKKPTAAKASAKTAKNAPAKANQKKPAKGKVAAKSSGGDVKSKSGAKAASRTKAAVKAKAPAKSKSPAKTKAPTKKNTAAKTKAAAARALKRVTKESSANALKPGEFSLGMFGVTPYQPKMNEEYMSDTQLEHFREILIRWKNELKAAVDQTIHHLQDEEGAFPDANDRASQETDFGLELRTRDRERKLVRKIDQALDRIAQGEYGYCEVTGEEIGLARLEARPIATRSFEAQERYERVERHYDT